MGREIVAWDFLEGFAAGVESGGIVWELVEASGVAHCSKAGALAAGRHKMCDHAKAFLPSSTII